MFGIGLPELALILVIALIIFGPGRLPEIGKSIGKALGEFRRASQEMPAHLDDDGAGDRPAKGTEPGG